MFVTNPQTLAELVKKHHAVTAPMLRSDGLYSNFWCGMTEDYYYTRTEVRSFINHYSQKYCRGKPADLANFNLSDKIFTTIFPIFP